KIPEGNWGKIVHDNDSMWLAGWTDYLTEKRKYVWLADTAGLKQDRDKAKYEKAVKLSKEIEKIKDRMVKDMKDKDPKISRIATVCYLIYRTAMRVGDEKDPDEADTVGATTLRKEHINITDNTIEFDFLGKDSVRWQETVKAEGNDKQFQENLKKIIQNKKPKDQIFEDITSRHVNAYYSSIVNGLTAKVFRTYLATTMVKNYLKEHDSMKGKTPNEKLYHAKLANLEAAIMCNHKRTIPKTFEESLENKRETLKNISKEQPWKKTLDALKKAESSEDKTDAQKKNKAKKIKTLNEQIKKQKEKHKDRIEKLQLQIDLSEKTKDYNLGTSLRNYIDPRIFKAWTNEVGAEWEKLYTAALQKKFLWVQNEKVSWSELAKD
ncbi:MAG: DNA topoisomerase I, partial [Nitrosarchaeum sp.]